MARVPDAVQRLFGGAPQSRDPQKRSMDPGSATHHAAKERRVAQHPGHAIPTPRPANLRCLRPMEPSIRVPV